LRLRFIVHGCASRPGHAIAYLLRSATADAAWFPAPRNAFQRYRKIAHYTTCGRRCQSTICAAPARTPAASCSAFLEDKKNDEPKLAV
jgi:hypothetical protein